MARKSSKPALEFPVVGETYMCHNGEQRKVVSVYNGYIEWTRVYGVGFKSGTFDLRSWHTGVARAIHRIEA